MNMGARVRAPSRWCASVGLMAPLLDLASGLPERSVDKSDVIIRDAEPGGSIWILVEGEVLVRKGRQVVASISDPGAPFGEMSVLLGSDNTATVEAATACRFLVAQDGKAWLDETPEAMWCIARSLARRLQVVTSYLADLHDQYADADVGLGMIDQVLASLVSRSESRAEPGSERDPEGLY